MTEIERKKRSCNGKLIFRRYRKNPKTGKVLDARNYGFKAWPICLGDWITKEKTVPTSTV